MKGKLTAVKSISHNEKLFVPSAMLDTSLSLLSMLTKAESAVLYNLGVVWLKSLPPKLYQLPLTLKKLTVVLLPDSWIVLFAIVLEPDWTIIAMLVFVMLLSLIVLNVPSRVSIPIIPPQFIVKFVNVLVLG